MTDVARWLESLGLGQYRQPFAEQAIDEAVLRDLTDADLKELGVRLGHRRKLLRAIRELELKSLGAEPVRDLNAPEEAERRHLTVLFCDLVGSAALTTRLDLDDMGAVMTAYHGCVAEVLARHGGFVDEMQGDGVLGLFGFPQAREDDAERALHAGLELVKVVPELRNEARVHLQVRVGVATGAVVVRRQVGAGPARRQRVVGDAPNLAARLQSVAEPGTVVICRNTFSITGGLFVCRELGARVLKGWTEPVNAWQLVAPSEAESRFEASHARLIATPFGRDEELEVLERRWHSAVKGEGRVVIVTGEAGIGKSHLVRTLQQRIEHDRAHTPHTGLRFFCSPHHVNSALYPFIGQLERAAGFHAGDSGAEKLAKLAQVFAEPASAAPDAVAVLGHLLSLPAPDGAFSSLSPQKRRARTLEVLLAQIEALAARRPVLAIFEDVHWIDPTSLELLTLLVERVPKLALLLIITARNKDHSSEFRPPWAWHAHVKTLVLNYLGRKDSEALARRVAAGKELPVEILDEIVDRAEGVPLYIEEYTRTVLHRGAASAAIPNTLHASLMERLDRLGNARDVAQTAAAIGRDFSYELLAAVWGGEHEDLEAALQELVRSEFVFQRGEPPHAMYRFKHVLLRDEAYEGLVKPRRMALHAAIARALEEQFPEISAAQPETLAEHFALAGLPQRALAYWLRAGRNASRRFANVEAIAHLRRGLGDLEQLAAGAERDSLELELTFELAQCLIATQGPASSASLSAFNRARELCERLGEAPQYPQVMFWLATAGVVRGELDRALGATAAMQRDAEARADIAATMNAVRGMAMIRLFMGRLAEAREGIERALALFNDADEAQRLAARAAGQDPGAASHAQIAWVLWLLGSDDAALERMEAAFTRARAIGHPHTEAYTSYYAAILYALRGEYDKAEHQARRCLVLAEEHGFRQWLVLARAVIGACRSMLGATPEPLEAVQKELDAYRAAGYQLGITVLHALRCQALLVNRRPERALEDADLGLATAQSNNERIVEAELCRLKARALVDCGAPPPEARIWLERAVATARAQGARSLELRALNDLSTR